MKSQVLKAYCTGCGNNFRINSKRECITSNGKGEVKGYCAKVRQRVVVELSSRAQR